eukprot:902365-Rhodomonas_salina.1
MKKPKNAGSSSRNAHGESCRVVTVRVGRSGGKQDGKKKRQHRKRASSGGGGGSADGLGEAE